MRPLILLLLLLLPTQALALNRIELKPKTPGAIGLELEGEYRLQFSILDDFLLDAEDPPATHGQRRWLDNRIRAGFALQIDRLRFATEWDLLTGQIAGDLWNLGGVDARHRDIYGAVTPFGFVPRRISAMARWAPLDLEVGLVTSHWGLGMLANDGNHDPFFGRNDLGDRVVRVRATGRPLYASKEPDPARDKLFVTGTFDFVVADDFGSLDDNQLAMQGVLSLLYRDPGHCAHGVYVVYRHQREPDDTGRTDAFVLDLFMDQTIKLPLGSLRLAVEGALLAGTTSSALNYNARDEMQVGAGGVTGLATLAVLDGALQVHLRGGWASGDDDPDDEFSRSFGFDREFDVGMVLFDQFLGAQRASMHTLLTDPENSGHPPRGIDGIVNEGSAASTAFLQPVLQGKPLPFLDLKGGVLAAWASADYRHPFYSFRAGGSARNQHDRAPKSRYLGTEFNWSVGIGGELPFKKDHAPWLSLEAVIQGGHLLVGDALAATDEGGELVNHVLMTGRFRW